MIFDTYYNDQSMKGFTKSGIVIVTTLALVVFSSLSFLLLLPKLHDQTLYKFAQSLTSIPLPQGSQQVGQLFKVGQQIANGDHCDYFAGEMIKTDSPKDRFENYYKTHYAGKTQLKFVWLGEDNEYTSDSTFDPTEIHTLKDWIGDKAISGKADVVVYIFEAAMTSALDLRCR